MTQEQVAILSNSDCGIDMVVFHQDIKRLDSIQNDKQHEKETRRVFLKYFKNWSRGELCVLSNKVEDIMKKSNYKLFTVRNCPDRRHKSEFILSSGFCAVMIEAVYATNE